MKKLLRLFRYEIKYAFYGIKRHFLLCLSAMSAIAISLLLIFIFFGVSLHVDRFSSNVENDLSIHVVLKNDIHSKEQISYIEKELKDIKNVDVVKLSDKDQELELMIKEKGEAFSLYRGEENPLSNAFFVYVKDGNQIEKTANIIEKLDYVDSVAYGGDSVNRLMDMLEWIRKIGYGVAFLLLLLSLYLINNTIRNTILSRQDEIIIMRQVGATNGFIKIPFELQGVLIGLIGAMVPVALIIWGYPQLYDLVNGQLFISKFSLIPPENLVWFMSFLTIVLGIFVGWLASWWAVNKYLKIKR